MLSKISENEEIMREVLSDQIESMIKQVEVIMLNQMRRGTNSLIDPTINALGSSVDIQID